MQASIKIMRNALRVGGQMMIAHYSIHFPRFCGGVMPKDSIETLLLRHYGNTAHIPAGLEEQLLASTRHKAMELRQRQEVMAHLLEKRVSRRHAVRLVAIST